MNVTGQRRSSALWLIAAYAVGLGTGMMLVRAGLEMEIELAERAALEESALEDGDYLPVDPAAGSRRDRKSA